MVKPNRTSRGENYSCWESVFGASTKFYGAQILKVSAAILELSLKIVPAIDALSQLTPGAKRAFRFNELHPTTTDQLLNAKFYYFIIEINCLTCSINRYLSPILDV